jgi:hypothetical protein
LRALTIRHPYAQAVACGLKKIETLGQGTRYRGRLAIHAALGHALPLAVADLDSVLADCRAAGADPGTVCASLKEPESWSFGKFIAVAELSDCVPVEELALDPIERAFGDYAPSAGGSPVSCGCLSPFRREACRGSGQSGRRSGTSLSRRFSLFPGRTRVKPSPARTRSLGAACLHASQEKG